MLRSHKTLVCRLSVVLLTALLAACNGSSGDASAERAGPADGGSPGASALTLDDERIVLEADKTRAVVTRNPFHFAVEDAAGHTVLSQVANTAPPPFLALPIPDPELLGSDILPASALQQPFTFELGARINPQFPGLPWQGNLITGIGGGIQYSATKVVNAEPAGDGVKLTLATNDPLWHKLVVGLHPDPSGMPGFRVTARVTPTTGVSAMASAFDSPVDESFFGFGGRHNTINQRGNSFVNCTQQENLGAGPLQPLADLLPGTGGKRYLFPNGPAAAYYPQTTFVSSQGYGFMLENTELSRYRLAYQGEPSWQVSAEAAHLDFTILPGDMRQAVKSLSAINGRHRVPPAWALGPTLQRGVRILSAQADTADIYFAKAMDDLDHLDADDLSVTSYTIEGWDLMTRGQLATVVDRLRAGGRHPMMYIRAFSGADAANTEDPAVFQQALSRGYCAKTLVGGCYLFGSPFIAGVALLVDFTNPRAVSWWGGRIRELLRLGADGFMQDFGENAMTGMRFANGETGLTMHNRYPVLYHKTTRAVLDTYGEQHPQRKAQAGGGFYFYTRAGFSGRPGSAAYESANFPGDNETSFSRSNGLASVITDMLSRGIGGAYGYSTDIGGYLDELTGTVTKELFIRWSELAALTPIFRVHNSSTNGVRMPWDFDAETLAIWRRMAELHLAAKPLILRLWKQAQQTGQPVARPLWLEYPNDSQARKQDQEFLLGPDVLVAPVVTQGATSRSVYFPEGCWQAPDTGDQYVGSQTIDIAAPLGRLPYFFRCGKQPFANP